MSTTKLNKMLEISNVNCKVFMIMKIGDTAQVVCSIQNNNVKMCLMSILNVDKVIFV